MEVYLGMCRRWRELPKPTIAMVQGACIAGGLMLAWCCDLIVAADDAFFADPVVRMGIPGVEYFAHPWVLGPRFAKEVLFTGDRFSAERAYQVGMVNRVVPRAELATATFALAGQIAAMPAFGLALAKRAVNQCEDQMGLRPGMDCVFGLHHLAHAHNAEMAGDSLAGQDARSMKQAGPVTGELPGRGAGLAGRARAGRAAAVGGHRRGVRPAPGLGAGAVRGPAGRGVLARRVRRPGRLAARLAGVRGGVPRGGRPGPGRPERLVPARADAVRARHGRAAGPAAAPDGPGRRRLGAGLVGAGGGQRPGRDPGPRGHE